MNSQRNFNSNQRLLMYSSIKFCLICSSKIEIRHLFLISLMSCEVCFNLDKDKKKINGSILQQNILLAEVVEELTSLETMPTIQYKSTSKGLRIGKTDQGPQTLASPFSSQGFLSSLNKIPIYS